MVDVRLAIRPVLVQCLQHLLIQSNNHDVRPNVEFVAASHRVRLVRQPESTIHIRDSDTLHIGRTTGDTILDELQKDLVKAAGLIMGAGGKARKTGPPIVAGPKNPIFSTRRSWPVEHSCILRNELRASLQSGCDLLLIRLRLARCWRLSAGHNSGDQYEESGGLHNDSPWNFGGV